MHNRTLVSPPFVALEGTKREEQSGHDNVPLAAPHQRSWAATDVIFAAVALASIVPSLLVRYPPSVDYLNHLARLFVLAAPADDPVHEVYRVHWHLLPNLALDLLAVPLRPLLSPEATMKLAWILCVLGMAAAIWFLHRSFFARTQPTLMLAAIPLINLPLSAGLINFMLGLPVALAAIGLWVRLGDRATFRSIIILNLAASLALIMHLAAAFAMALTIGSMHVFRPPLAVNAIARRAGEIAAGFVLPALLLIAMMLPWDIAEEAGISVAIAYQPLRKLNLAAAPVFTGSMIADIIGVVLLWPMLLAVRLQGGRWHRGLVAPLLVWLFTLLALPNVIGRASVIDLRLAVFPTMLLIAATAFAPARRIWATAVIAAGIVGVLARTAVLVPEWRLHEAHVQSFRVIDSVVERGARVLVASAEGTMRGNCREPYYWSPLDEHIPALLVIDRAAFVSTLFAMPGLQPIEPTPAVRGIAAPDLGIIPWSMLAFLETEDGERKVASSARGSPWRAYPRDWRRVYDYLALLHLNCAAEISGDPGLVPVGESMSFRLYRIVHPPA